MPLHSEPVTAFHFILVCMSCVGGLKMYVLNSVIVFEEEEMQLKFQKHNINIKEAKQNKL